MLQVDGELELLRHVVRIDLQRELGLTQRPLEITEAREGEAQVVVRFGVPWTRLNRPREGVLRVLVLLQVGEHEPDPVPGDGMLGLPRQCLTISLEGLLEALSLVEKEGEIEPRLHEGGLDLECPT